MAHQGDVPLSLGVRARHREGRGDPAALVAHRISRRRRRVQLGTLLRRAADRAPRRGGLERDHRAGDRGRATGGCCGCSTRISSTSRFVFGERPAAADFALYGQLTQLAGFDPTPRAIALETAPRVVAWVDTVEDLSGLEPRDDGLAAARRDSRDAARAARRGRPGLRAVPARQRRGDRARRRAGRVRRSTVGPGSSGRSRTRQSVSAGCARCTPRCARTIATPSTALLAGTGCEALFTR